MASHNGAVFVPLNEPNSSVLGYLELPSNCRSWRAKETLNRFLMQRVKTLQEQAELLRQLAKSFDMPTVKEDLLRLAERCDRLAQKILREVMVQRGPITDPRSSAPLSNAPDDEPE